MVDTSQPAPDVAHKITINAEHVVQLTRRYGHNRQDRRQDKDLTRIGTIFGMIASVLGIIALLVPYTSMSPAPIQQQKPLEVATLSPQVDLPKAPRKSTPNGQATPRSANKPRQQPPITTVVPEGNGEGSSGALGGMAGESANNNGPSRIDEGDESAGVGSGIVGPGCTYGSLRPNCG